MKKEIQVSDELIRWSDNFWDDPEKVMNLIDLLFLGEDPSGHQFLS